MVKDLCSILRHGELDLGGLLRNSAVKWQILSRRLGSGNTLVVLPADLTLLSHGSGGLHRTALVEKRLTCATIEFLVLV